MKYDKRPLSVQKQAQRLIDRGLVCDDVDRLHHYLNHIGYYRLSAYWLPFERPAITGETSRNHQFIDGTTLQQVLSLYIFDRKLRLLVMEAMERIEIAVRSRWANSLALRHGSHAHMNPELFSSPWRHAGDIAQMASALENSSEVFVVHYKQRYQEPFLPPIWAVVETLTLGALSRWFSRTRDTKVKQDVAKGLGMPTADILEKVLHALTPVRNVCAHHGRLWNRRFVLQLPVIKKLRNQITVESVVQSDGSVQNQPYRQLYNYLVVMNRLMQHINRNSGWLGRLCSHIATATPDQQRAMGFPEGWEAITPWNGANQ